MEAIIYHILKDKGAITFKKNSDNEDAFDTTIKNFDNLTGERLDDIKDIISFEQIDESIKTTDKNIKALNQTMSNLIMLKEDLSKVN